MSQIFQKSITLNSKKVFFIKNKFSKNKQNIIMLPGWPVSCYMFEPIIKNLESYNCLAIDLPGFGSSFHSGKNYSLDFYKSFLEKFIKKQYKNQKITIFGYSIGAIHAINLITQKNKNIYKLTLFSPPIKGNQICNQTKENGGLQKVYIPVLKLAKKYPSLLKIGSNQKLRTEVTKFLYTKAYQKLYPDFENFVDKKFQNILLEETNKFDLRAVFQTAYELTQIDFTNKLKTLNIPTLLLTGDKDKVVDAIKIKNYTDNNSNIQFKILENTSHASCVLNPKTITNEIETFLN